MRKSTAKYTAIGYVVSKLVIPVARKQAKKAAKAKARGAVTGTKGALGRHPARTSVAVGAAIGAVGWLVSRRASHDDLGE